MENSSNQQSLFERLIRFIIGVYTLSIVFYLLGRQFQPDFWLVGLLNNGVPYLFLPIIPFWLITNVMRSRAQSIYLIVIGVIALIWLAPIFLPQASPVLTETALDVVSFNVYPDNTEVERAVDWLLTTDADILLLQEFNPETSMGQLERLSAEYPYQSVMADIKYATYSRYPIVLEEVILANEKPAQRLILEVDNQRVVVYNIHMLMPTRTEQRFALPFVPDFILKYDEAPRDRQIFDLLSAMQLETQSMPVIFAGDFNMSEFSQVYSALERRLVDTYRTVKSDFGATWGGISEEFPNGIPYLLRLDYVWVTPNVTPLDAYVGPELGSDHRPLSVTLQLPEGL